MGWKNAKLLRGRWRHRSWVSLAIVGGLGLGCATDVEQSGSDFVADNPNGSADGRGDGGDDAAGEGTGGANGDSGGDDGGEREVSEADIVFVEGDRLYALSPYGGLAVIDVSAPDQGLPVLGRYKMHGQPFEMYVEDGQVFVMMNDFGSYGWNEDDGAYEWRSTSELLALDATDPANISSRGEFAVPGWIQDSRRVGDVLYLVTWEDGWCWGCNEAQPRTVVTSLDVSNTAQVQIVDQLEFANQTDDEWDWSGPRSVIATDERMYVGGIEYDNFNDGHSVIDVIDISDPAGDLVQGASFQVAGSIESRWQMDEFDGVLRVISQPWSWRTEDSPVVETFAVASASEVTPLASLAMTLPRPERLQSVRFDGARAYAITFMQTDPLFTLDLADPEDPKQVGELEIPGWVYHMEPRGDRIVALGFDRNNPEGSLNVSLFDVADLAAPALLSRVHFGGDWADFGEDQNRIHKAFTILADLGLIMVPYAGWDYSDDGFAEELCGAYRSGIQIVDWAQDALTLRGVAPSTGRARRALVHRDRLLALSEQAVQAFDITDRDAPALASEAILSSNVTDVAVSGGLVARLGHDWWTDQVTLDVVPVGNAEVAEPLGRVRLAQDGESGECGYRYPVDLFVHNSHAYLLENVYSATATDYKEHQRLTTIDLTVPSQPEIVDTLDLEFNYGYGGWEYGLGNGQKNIVIAGDQLVFNSTQSRYSGDNYLGETGRLQVVDLTNPGAPRMRDAIERPDALAFGALQTYGSTVVSWHTEAVSDNSAKVRFFLDRFEVGDDGELSAADPINVPGQVVYYDEVSQRAVTAGFVLEETQLRDEACWSNPKVWYTNYDEQACILAHRPLHLLAIGATSATLLDTLDVEGAEARLAGVLGTRDRLFASLQYGGSAWGWGVDDVAVGADSSGGGASQAPEYRNEVAVITGHTGDALTESSRATLSYDSYWSSLIGALTDRLVFVTAAGIGVVDASNAAAPTVTVIPTYGWGCYGAEVASGMAFCPQGPWGLQAVELP